MRHLKSYRSAISLLRTVSSCALVFLSFCSVALAATDASASTNFAGSRLAVAKNADGRIEVFKINADGELHHKWQRTPGGNWSPWSSLGGSFLPGIVVTTNSDGRLEIFCIDKVTRALRHTWQNDPGGSWWQGWPDLEGSFRPPICVGQNLDRRLHVFGVNPRTTALKHIWQTNPAEGWSAWSELPGFVQPGVAVGRNVDGGLALFAISATNQTLIYCRQETTNDDSHWSKWISLGGAPLPGFAVAQNADGRLEVFAVMTNGLLAHVYQRSTNRMDDWSNWENLGREVPIKPGISVANDAEGRVCVFAVNESSGAMMCISQLDANGGRGWTPWNNLGGDFESGPALTRTTDGRLDLFAFNRKISGVSHLRQETTNGGWSIWSSLETSMVPYASRLWQTDEGLPHNLVQAVTQTADGYVWAGTRAGLARFDGMHFTVFDTNNTQELKSMSVTALCGSKDGALWIGTDGGGLTRFQNGTFVHFTKAEGFADDNVRTIYETKDGSIWIGANQGLSRFQNGKFTHYTSREGLLSEIVRALYEDGDGNLWIATGGGLNRLKVKDGEARPHPNPLPPEREQTAEATARRESSGNSSGSSFRETANISPSPGGEGEQTAQTRTDAKKVPANFESFSGSSDLSMSSLRCVCGDREGVLWFGSNYGVVRHDNGRFYLYEPEKSGLADRFVSALYEDRQGVLWVGTYGGLYRFDDGKFVSEPAADGTPYDQVNCLFEDREGNLWIGSKEGLIRLNPKRFVTYTLRQGLTHNNAMSVFEDSAGSLWIGTWGGGLNRLKDEIITAYTASNGLPHGLILSTWEGRDGSLWIGADYDGGLHQLKEGEFKHYTKENGLINAALRVLYEDRAGDLWIGTRKGLSRFRDRQFTNYTNAPPDGVGASDIRVIHEDRDGVLWIGTEAGLACRRDEKFFTVPAVGRTVVSIYEDEKQTLWIGTDGGGLYKLNASGSKLEIPNTATSTFNLQTSNFTTKDGLFSDQIFEILEDDFSYFWMSCLKGIFRASKKELEEFAQKKIPAINCVAYGKADGLASVQCNGVAKPSGWKSRDGRLWFPTTKGIVAIEPKIKANEVAPPVVIEEVIFDKSKVSSLESKVARAASTRDSKLRTQDLFLKPGHGELEFHYTALSFQIPEKNRFKYKLEGIDSQWVDAGGRRVAYYAKIPPGRYQFRVVGSNNDGVWSEKGATLDFVLLPHFWQTLWFRALCFLSAGGLVAGIARYFTKRKMRLQLQRLEQQHALEKERTRIAQDIHDDLGAGLTQITMLSDLAEADRHRPDEVLGSTQKISTTAREMVQALDEIVWAVSPKNDTLKSLVGYLGHFASEFLQNTPIRCRISRPTEIPHCVISSEVRHNVFLVFKETLNNAVKYSGASEIRIRISCDNGDLRVTIEDDGCGFDVDSRTGSGNGLDNMRERMTEVGGRYELASEPGKGTGTTLTISFNGNGAMH